MILFLGICDLIANDSAALRPASRPQLREARLPLNGPSPQLTANTPGRVEDLCVSSLPACLLSLGYPLFTILRCRSKSMYTPPCILTCRRYLPLDVITQPHDEWLYISVLFQFQPLKIGIYIFFSVELVAPFYLCSSIPLYTYTSRDSYNRMNCNCP